MNNFDGDQPFVPTPQESEKIRIAMEVADSLKAVTTPYLASIAGIISDEDGEYVGTGTFISVDHVTYLLTADHVISAAMISPFRGVAISNGDGKAYCRVIAPFRRNAALDIAIVPVALAVPPEGDRIPCPERLIGKSSNGLESDLLFIHGVPGSYTRFLVFDRGIHTKTLPYISVAGNPTWRGFDSAVHCSIEYNPRDQRYSDGTSADLPDPGGMSGAALWKTNRSLVRENWTPHDARITGVITRWDQEGQCLIGTRIEPILEFIGGM